MGNFEIMRELLRRFGWSKAHDDNWRETYFPPDGLSLSGITLDYRNGGTWERISPKDNSQLIETDSEQLEAYLEQVQPYVR